MAKVREEVDAVLRRYSGDQNAPIEERLLAIPLEAWETEFEILDLCLKDSIRLQMLGTAFRRNISGGGIKVGDEVIPNGAFVVCLPLLPISGIGNAFYVDIAKPWLCRHIIQQMSTTIPMSIPTRQNGTQADIFLPAPRTRRCNTVG